MPRDRHGEQAPPADVAERGRARGAAPAAVHDPQRRAPGRRDLLEPDVRAGGVPRGGGLRDRLLVLRDGDVVGDRPLRPRLPAELVGVRGRGAREGGERREQEAPPHGAGRYGSGAGADWPGVQVHGPPSCAVSRCVRNRTIGPGEGGRLTHTRRSTCATGVLISRCSRRCSRARSARRRRPAPRRSRSPTAETPAPAAAPSRSAPCARRSSAANTAAGADTIGFSDEVSEIFVDGALPDVSGTTAIDGGGLVGLAGDGTGVDGLRLTGSGSTVTGLSIAGFGGDGVRLAGGGGHTLKGTSIDAGGNAVAVAAPGNTVGGVEEGEGNTLAGTGGDGVSVLSGTGNRIRGNGISPPRGSASTSPPTVRRRTTRSTRTPAPTACRTSRRSPPSPPATSASTSPPRCRPRRRRPTRSTSTPRPAAPAQAASTWAAPR